MAHEVIAAAVAVASAIAFAGATVGQQRAAAETADEDARGGSFVRHLLTNPRWLAATGGTAVGYVLQAVALGFGSVVVVQPILVTSLLFALPLGAYLAHHRLSRTAGAAGLALAVSLAVFLALANPNRGVSHGSLPGWLLASAVIVPVSTACLLIANRRRGPVRASLLAITVGLFGGALAVLTKAVVDSFGNGLVSVLTDRETYGLVVVGLVGIYLQQLSFQAGDLHASLPIMTVLEPVTAAVLGIGLLHERLQVGGAGLAALIVAALVMAVATVVLAREEAHLQADRSPDSETPRT